MNQETKNKYDKKPIDQIESEIRKDNAEFHQARRSVVEALVYLKSTKRYKENPLYRNSSFKTYLTGEFNMRERTLIELNKAYNDRPEECERFGVGLVSKVHKRCNPTRARKVWEEIGKAVEKRKTPITRTKIDEIINKFQNPKPDNPAPETPGWKELYLAEKKKNDNLSEKYRIAMEELEIAHRRIEKLKAAVVRLKDDQPEREYA